MQKRKKIQKIYLLLLLGIAFFLNTNNGTFAANNPKVNEVTRNVINEPNQANITSFTKTMLKESKKAYKENKLEEAADYLRSALYFLKQSPNSLEYQEAKTKLDEINSKLGINVSEDSRFELAKSLYKENKLFASAYEFSTLLKEGYKVDSCYVNLGIIAEELRSEDAAYAFYKNAVENNPENVNAKYKYATALLKNGKTNDALYYLEQVIEETKSKEIIKEIISTFTDRALQNPKDENNFGILGLAYQKLGDYNKTYKLLRKSLVINPNDIFLRYHLGNLLFSIQEYKFAEEIYTEILEENPYESQIRIARAKAYAVTGQTEKAVNDYQVVLAMYPDSIQAQYGLYLIYKKQLPLEKIINKFYPLEANYKLDAEGYNNLGYFANKFERTEDAIVFFEKSKALNPKSETPYIELYKLYQLLGQNNKAKAIIEEGHKAVPKNSEIVETFSSANSDKIAEKNKLAQSYINAGDYNKAVKVYEQIQPKNAETYEALGSCYRQIGDLKNSVSNYKKATELNPNNSELYYALGVTYLELNNDKQARDAFKKSVQLDSKNIKSKKMLTYIEQKQIANSLDKAYDFYEKKDYNSALKYLNAAVDTFPNDSKVYYYRALTNEALGDYKSAVSDLRETIKIDRKYVIAYYKLAENLERVGKHKEALTMYEKYLGAEDIDENLAKRAQQRIIELGEKYY